MSATAALMAGSIALPVLLVLARYRRRRRQEPALLAARYGRRVFPLGMRSASGTKERNGKSSVLRIGRAIRFAGGGLPRCRWMLQLTGLPKEIHEQLDVLKQFLDNIILLCGTIILRIHRRVRVT